MKKYSNDNIRKLNRVGRVSYSIIIPKNIVKELKWRERQKLKLKLKGKIVIIKDAK